MEKMNQSIKGLCMLLLISLVCNVILVGAIIGIINHNNTEKLFNQIAQEECMPDETPSMNTNLPPLEVIEDLK